MSAPATQLAKRRSTATGPCLADGSLSLYASASLGCGLSLLRCFMPEEQVLGIADLSERTGIAPSSMRRYAQTLVALGYLERLPSHKYRLGRLTIELGLAALRIAGMRELARPWLSWVRGFTTSLALLNGEDLCLRGVAAHSAGWAGHASSDSIQWARHTYQATFAPATQRVEMLMCH